MIINERIIMKDSFKNVAMIEGNSKFENAIKRNKYIPVDNTSSLFILTKKPNKYTFFSFVSDKNTNVNSVQFVIKSESIEKKEVNEETEDKKENLTMWQKFLNLFKK